VHIEHSPPKLWAGGLVKGKKEMAKKMEKDLVSQAKQLREQTELLEKQTIELEKQVKLAKGTRTIARGTEYYVGDEGPTPELLEAIRKMLTERPLTFQALLDATGARPNRIKGVIMRLQREGARVVNLGNEARALWFIPDPGVLDRIMRAKQRVARK
jgi:uncharacterized protein (DUF2461 family)